MEIKEEKYIYQRYDGKTTKYLIGEKYLLNIETGISFPIDTLLLGKVSENILDILEVGDILRVFDNLSETEEKVNIFDDEMLKAVKEDIKDNNYKILSILTHEQFSSLEYII